MTAIGSQRRRVEWALLLLLLLAAAVRPADAEFRSIEAEGLKIIFDSDWATSTAPGYLPARFDITNLADARLLEIVGRGTHWVVSSRSGRQVSIDVRQIVRLARGDRITLTLPIPVFGDNANIVFEVRENGRSVEQFGYFSLRTGRPPADASALIVLNSNSDFGTLAAGWARPIPRSYGGPMPGAATAATPRLDFLLEPVRLPSNWIGFSSVRTVLIGSQEWDRLNDPQKSALRSWTACGGDLIFVDGTLDALFPNDEGRPSLSPEGTFAPYFFGRIHLLASSSIESAGLPATIAATENGVDPHWALPANRSPDWGRIVERGFLLPIPGVDGVPARAYLSILVAFAVLIGPVNYIVLRRRRRQVLLVLTTPVIAAVFIALLGVYVVAGEGFGVRSRAISFTRLDQTRKQAATRASVSLYAAGMTPSGGLGFPRDMAVFPLGPDGKGGRDAEQLDLTDMQRFSGGLVRARAPSNFEVVGFRPARERLTFQRHADHLSVVNGLGAPVTHLAYRQGDTLHTLDAPLAAGATAALHARPRARRPVLVTGELLPARFDAIVDNQPDGSYLAVLERSPFWDPGVAATDERGSFHVVLGSGVPAP